jgi:hypothetical protein
MLYISGEKRGSAGVKGVEEDKDGVGECEEGVEAEREEVEGSEAVKADETDGCKYSVG